MSARMVLDVSEYPSLVQGPRGGLWWGMAGLVLVEVVLFTTLIATYYYLKFLNPHWPPAGEPLPKLLLPTVNTAILVGSSFAIYYADTSISERGDKRGMTVGLVLSLLLGLTFLVLKGVEYAQVEYFWDSHAYGSIVWTMIVFHSSHVLSVVLKTVVVLALAAKGHWTRERCQGIKVNGLYWHFVVVIWIPLYLTIYWTPRIHG
ncbi:MAG TPA: cytochrome c oxidase subunit 3 [Longimicrobiaceae bacterium]|nr:cytochrome c oxidase subunit 3 [Longimicrobiaceae bacterium]